MKTCILAIVLSLTTTAQAEITTKLTCQDNDSLMVMLQEDSDGAERILVVKGDLGNATAYSFCKKTEGFKQDKWECKGSELSSDIIFTVENGFSNKAHLQTKFGFIKKNYDLTCN